MVEDKDLVIYLWILGQVFHVQIKHSQRGALWAIYRDCLVSAEAEFGSNYLEITFYSKMIPVLCDEISEVEQTLETVIKKLVLRLSDLVKVNQPRLKFGFSFSSRKVYTLPNFPTPESCFDG